MKLRTQALDLTGGEVWKQLALFFSPILLGNLFQQLYTTADAVIIGHFTGKQGLAAIDSVYNLLKLPVNFFTGLSTGATILIAQKFGKKSERELSKAVHTAVAFALAGGVVLSLLGLAFAPGLLRRMDVPSDIYPMTHSYVRIYFGGLVASMLYNIGAGILRAVGDSRTPLYYLIASSLVNVLTDLLFVGVLGMGVAGAAWSTVLAQLVSAVLVVRALMKTRLACRLIPRQIRFHPQALKSILIVGLPIALQSALYPLANLMIQANINRLGTDSIAAWALCGKLDFLIWIIIDSLASAVSTFAAQNYGAGKMVRIRRGLGLGLVMTLGLIGLLSAVLFFWSVPLGRLFISEAGYDVLPLTGEIMRFLAPLYLLYVFGEVLSGGIRATGETLAPLLLTLLGTCALRILWVIFFVPQNRSLLLIIAAYPASWLATSAGMALYYLVVTRKKLRV